MFKSDNPDYVNELIRNRGLIRRSNFLGNPKAAFASWQWDLTERVANADEADCCPKKERRTSLL